MDSRIMRMDSEFDKILVDIKPHLLKLPHKTERQRCALWIKKLCEPVGSSTARKNRNMYAKLLLHMLHRGVIENPFSSKPDSGPLQTLPSYMTLFFEDTTSAIPTKGLGLRDNFEDELAITATPDWARDVLQTSSETFSGESENTDPVKKYNFTRQPQQKYGGETFQPIHFSTIGKSFDSHGGKHGISSFRDEQSLINMHEKEIEMKTKVLEARFHEEKLSLQHKHDLAVQKILDRKNSEIDELKRHYKGKEKEYDDSKRKLERKVQVAVKEVQAIKENKEKEIEDLNTLIDEKTESLRTEYEAKIQDMIGSMEREKYELQKGHTKSIQDLLEDTNQRLTNMEDEYNSQSQATKVVVGELERHVAQLTQETESMASARQVVISEKQQLEMEQSRIVKELQLTKTKCEDLQDELNKVRQEYSNTIRSLSTKNDANIEYLKQEQSISSTRAHETIRDLEDQIQSLKHAVQDSEQQRAREIREKESLHQQDSMSMQHLHDKQMHSLRSEWDHERTQLNKATKALEDVVKEKDEQIVKLTLSQKQSTVQAEQAIESYKKQVSDAQQKVYADMRSQLEKVELDLEQSKINRTKLQEEFKKELDELKERHNDEMAETKVMYEHDVGVMTQRYTVDRDKLVRDYENQLSSGESRLRDALEQQEKIAEERRLQHQEVMSNMEQQIRELREELVSANALRRQQLVELGLLREEERQKAARDHDLSVQRLESEIDRQRMELHQQHASELEQQALKTKNRFEQLESEYRERLDRAHERMLEAQNKEAQMREAMIQARNETEEQLLNNAAKLEEEQSRQKTEHNSLILNLQASLERERTEHHQLQRHSQQIEYDLKQNLSRVKLECEERLKGLLPNALKVNLEETIACLRSQIKSLQQRIDVLEDFDDLERVKSIGTDSSLNL
ncbi:centrosomal protein of 112 kDa-like isoform X1 [Clavelina lepadiformis]|uniref:centrosomal protein of 112 kDa-like isoform X1 n=1 Tax=Clavelina lepadiformis TaxID=159417 RepID=UPI0040412E2B